MKAEGSDVFDCVLVGGGVASLSAAMALKAKRLSCAIVEAQPTLGGLVASYDFGDFAIEKFYHHLQRNDHAAIDMIHRVGLKKHLEWPLASTAYLFRGHRYPLDTPFDILRFPGLSVGGAFKLRNLVKQVQRGVDVNALDNVTVKEWIVETCGEKVFENFFAPLLNAKFGADASDISAAWLAGRIQFRSHRSWRGERLGYLRGGFHKLVDAVHDRLKDGVTWFMGCPVRKIEKQGNLFHVFSDQCTLKAKSVLLTVPPAVIRKLYPFEKQYDARLSRLSFQKIICAVIALNRPLQQAYWVNIDDPKVPFSVLLEHTNFIKDPGYPPGLIYLANYLGERDPMWDLEDEEIRARYTEGLMKYFKMPADAPLWIKIARSPAAGLIYRKGILADIPNIQSPVEGLFHVGLMRSFPERSINDSIEQGQQAAEQMIKTVQSI